MTETWQNLAEGAYQAALSLRQERNWRSVISRAYYAVYSRVAALLVARGVTMPAKYEGPLHAKLAELVIAHLTHLGDLRWTISAWIRALYAQRVIADYRPSGRAGENGARNALTIMTDTFCLLREKKS